MVDRPPYAAFATEVEEVAKRIVPLFHGEAHEEIQLIFGELQSGLRVLDISSRRINGGEYKFLAAFLSCFHDDIPELQHYEIDPQVISRLEAMQSELNAWKGELQARGVIFENGGRPLPPPA